MTLVLALLIVSPINSRFAIGQHRDYFSTISFRESPYSPVYGVKRLTEEQSETRNHYRFDYDSEGRVTQISFRLGEKLRARNHTGNYFWYTSVERHKYENDREIITYFDHENRPAEVQGKVFKSVYSLDKKGRRIGLRYFGQNGTAVDNHWGIHRYHWVHRNDGSVIEERFDRAGKPATLRPGFEFYRIRLCYDVKGLVALMQHVDRNGTVVGTKTGFAQDRFEFSRFGELIHYNVLDAVGKSISANTQGIARGNQTFTKYGYESVSTYENSKGEPAFNSNGWWRSHRQYDSFGNMIKSTFTDLKGNPKINQKTGYASAKITWDPTGFKRKSLEYFDEKNVPVNHKTRGYQATRFEYGDDGKISEIRLFDRKGRAVDHAVGGWHLRKYRYPADGKPAIVKEYSIKKLREKHLQTSLDLLRKRTFVPGMAVSIFKDGKKLWGGVSGFADIEKGIPVHSETHFRLASVSKVITSICLSKLVQEGSIKLSQSASELTEGKCDATIAQLMSHTGGVSHYFPGEDAKLTSDYRCSTEAVSTVIPHITDRKPGEKYQYSTFGFTLVAALMEKATGEKFTEILERVSKELGVRSVSSSPSKIMPGNLTKFYQWDGRKIVPARTRKFSYSRAGAGMVGTANGVAKLVSNYVSGGVINEKVIQKFFEVQRLNNGRFATDRSFRVAIGWRLQKDRSGRLFYHHAGVTDGARSMVLIDAKSGTVVVLLSNASWSGDMFGTTKAFFDVIHSGKAYRNSKIGNTESKVSFRGKVDPVEMVFEREREEIVIGRSENRSKLGSWLHLTGKGSKVNFLESPVGRTLVSPYGLTSLKKDSEGNSVGWIGQSKICWIYSK